MKLAELFLIIAVPCLASMPAVLLLAAGFINAIYRAGAASVIKGIERCGYEVTVVPHTETEDTRYIIR